MEKVHYTQAKIYFPRGESVSSDFRKTLPGIRNNFVSFMWGDIVVDLKISPFNLPEFLSKNKEVREKIIIPSIEDFLKDTDENEEFSREFVRTGRFAQEGKHSVSLTYEKRNGWFKIYDQMHLCPRPFESLYALQNINEKLTNPKWKDHCWAARSIHEEKGQDIYKTSRYYLETTSLGEALRKTNDIYELAEDLKKANKIIA